jgi:Capsule polysaccharide biosynthesis protein
MSRVCIIISICCPHFSDKAEFLLRLGQSLASVGHRVKVILAGNEACSHIIRLQEDPGLCGSHFNQFSNRLKQSYGEFEPSLVLGDETLESLVESSWLGLAHLAEKERTFEGFVLHTICRASLARRFKEIPERVATSEPTKFRHVQDAFQKDAVRHLIYYRNLFSLWKPDMAVYFGGQFHQDRCAFLISREMNVKAIAIEGSFIPNRLYLDGAGVTGARGQMSDASNIHWSEATRPHSSRSLAINQLLMASLGIRETEWSNRNSLRKLRRNSLGLQEDDKLALFLCQVPYDSSVISDGGDFSDQTVAIEALLELLNNFCAYKLLLRRHPKDRDSTLWTHVSKMIERRSVSSSKLLVSDGTDLLPDLMAADLAITINSQAGLQALWCGLPLVVLGRAFYGGKNFTFDVFGQREYLEPAFTLAASSKPGTLKSDFVSYLSLLESRYLVDINDSTGAVSRITELL